MTTYRFFSSSSSSSFSCLFTKWRYNKEKLKLWNKTYTTSVKNRIIIFNVGWVAHTVWERVTTSNLLYFNSNCYVQHISNGKVITRQETPIIYCSYSIRSTVEQTFGWLIYHKSDISDLQLDFYRTTRTIFCVIYEQSLHHWNERSPLIDPDKIFDWIFSSALNA